MSSFRDPESAADYEVQEKFSLMEWSANECRELGCTLEIVTNKSREGLQFCRVLLGLVGSCVTSLI